MRKNQEPTCVSLVSAELEGADDFRSAKQLIENTRLTKNRVAAALHHLKIHKAADFVVNADGTTWWFATPETDDRSRIVESREPEVKPRKPRKPYTRTRKGAKP